MHVFEGKNISEPYVSLACLPERAVGIINPGVAEAVIDRATSNLHPHRCAVKMVSQTVHRTTSAPDGTHRPVVHTKLPVSRTATSHVSCMFIGKLLQRVIATVQSAYHPYASFRP